MKRLTLVALTLGMPLAVLAQTVFNDTFTSGNDHMMVAPVAPTSTYTTWQPVGQKNISNSSISSGQLQLTFNAATSSGFGEIQALFTTTPVTLSAVGQSIGLQVVFTTDVSQTLLEGTGSYLYDGLYNASGVAPLSTLANTGLTTGSSTYATGGAQNWKGFIGRLGTSQTTSSSANNIVGRLAQSGTTQGNQALLANNASGGLGNNPIGVNVTGSGSAGVGGPLAASTVYTMYLNVALTGTGETITSTLYNGAGIGGSVVETTSGTALSSDTDYVTKFDGLAFGLRHAQTAYSITPVLDVNQVLVIADVPEPASAVLFGFGALALAMSYRRIRR